MVAQAVGAKVSEVLYFANARNPYKEVRSRGVSHIYTRVEPGDYRLYVYMKTGRNIRFDYDKWVCMSADHVLGEAELRDYLRAREPWSWRKLWRDLRFAAMTRRQQLYALRDEVRDSDPAYEDELVNRIAAVHAVELKQRRRQRRR